MSLKVIGAGHARTGTTSTKTALEILGVKPCYHMFELFGNFDHIPLWDAALNGDPADWESLIGAYEGTLDWPASFFWKQLADAYPDAKVLLTVREPDVWYASFDKTILAVARRMVIPPGPIGELIRLIEKCLTQAFGSDLDDRNGIIAAYKAHNDAVKEAIESPRLLVYNTSEGWEPLCNWLEMDVPKEGFPHLNTSDDFRGALAL